MFLKYTFTLARYLTTSIKFEPIIGSSIEIGKEDFVDFLKDMIKEFYQETFYYMKDTSDLPFELFENALYFRLEAVVSKLSERLTGDASDLKTFDQLEIDEILSSRLVVRSILIKSFYN